MVTYFDGRYLEDDQAVVSVRSRGLNYGLGCFGGIRGYLADDADQVYVFRLDDHVRRLNASAKLIFLRLTVSEAEAKAAIIEARKG